ncbi:MAG: hypothetical protein M3Q98_12510 [Actinomycetota bacterium]|nr:hypothetical protein [Actinomycetota bacterium]
MSSVRLGRAAAIAVSATALLVLSGCGFDVQTNQPYDAAVGSNHRGGQVEVLNALFVDNTDGTATFSATLLNKGTSAQILNAVTTTTGDGTPISSTLATPRELKPQTPYTPGTDGDIILTGEFPAGGFVKITLNFEDAAPVTINSPVVARNATYDGVATKTVVPEPSARTEVAPTEADAATG